MNNNITIIDKNGNTILAEGISYFKLNTISKKYLFYTLNEKVENDLIKMYVSEVNENSSDISQINDDEWNQLRQIMIMISKGDNLPDLEYLSMDNNAFNVGEYKKIAIKPSVIQSFKDAHTSSLISNQDISDSPAVEETLPSGNFFNTEIVEAPSDTSVDPSNNVEAPNIFDNPMKPESPMPEQNVVNQPNSPEVEMVSEIPNSVPEIPTMPNVDIAPLNTTDASLDTPIVDSNIISSNQDLESTPTPQISEESGSQVIPEEPVISEIPGDIKDTSVLDASVLPETPIISEGENLETSNILENSNKFDEMETLDSKTSLVYTKEEALRAVEIIKDIVNKYYNGDKTLNMDIMEELDKNSLDNLSSQDSSMIPTDSGNMEAFIPTDETPLISDDSEILTNPQEVTSYISTNTATPVAQPFSAPTQESIPVTMPDAYQEVKNINPGSMAGMSPSTLDANIQE